MKCRNTIEKGNAFRWWKPINSPIMRLHIWHGHPPMSSLVSSEHMKKAYEAMESILNWMDDISVLANNGCSSEEISERIAKFNIVACEAQLSAEEVANAYYESANAVEKRFGETPQVLDCRNKAKKIETWIAKIDVLTEECYEFAESVIYDKKQSDLTGSTSFFLYEMKKEVKSLYL